MRKFTMTFAAAGVVTFMLIGDQLTAATAQAAKKVASVKKVNTSKWAFLPEVVAEIDGKKITREEMSKMLDKMLVNSSYASVKREQVLKIISYNVISDYVEMQVLLKMAAKDGVKPSFPLAVEKIKESVSRAPKNMLNLLKQRLLAQKKSMDQYVREIASDPIIQDQVAIQCWVDDKLEPALKISPEQEKEFYEKNKKSMFFIPEQVEVSHILIGGKKDDASKKAAKAKATKLLADIKAGEVKFEDAAYKESLCPSGKEKNGRLPKFQHGMMAPAFDAASFALQNSGDLSDVIETSFGYHIIRLEKKFPAHQLKLSDSSVKKDIDQVLKGEMLRKIVEEKTNAAKKAYKVRIFVKAPQRPKAPAVPVAPVTK